MTHLRRFCDLLEARGQRGYLSVFAPMLGRSLCELGRYDEAEPLAQLGRELGAVHDTATQALWRQVQARVEARRGRFAEAEQLAREAVAINERTDYLNGQGDALWDLAEISASAATSTRPKRHWSRRSNATNGRRNDTGHRASGPSLDGGLDHAEHNRGDESECNIRSYNAKSAAGLTKSIGRAPWFTSCPP